MKTLLVTTVLTVVGCANSDNRIVHKTAKAINSLPNEVTLISVEKGMLDTEWKADVNGKIYNCYATDMLEDVICKPE